MTDDFDNDLDWLQDNNGDDDSSAAGDSDDDLDRGWLEDDAGEDVELSAAPDSDDLDLDWIQDADGAADGVSDDAGDDDVPDWLAATETGDADDDDDEEEAPDWLAAATVDDDDVADEEETPDWMMAAEVGDAGDDDGEETPDWLAATEADDDDDAEDAPDWLVADDEEPAKEINWDDIADDDDADDDWSEEIETVEPERRPSHTAELRGFFDADDDDWSEEIAAPQPELEAIDDDAAFADDDDDDESDAMDAFLAEVDDEPLDLEAMAEDDDVDDFFSEMSADLAEEAPSAAPGDDFFADEAFDMIQDDEGAEFDVLGDMVAESDDLDDLLEDEAQFDLFDELTGGDEDAADEDVFDLLGELTMEDVPQEALDALDSLDDMPVAEDLTADSVTDALDMLDELDFDEESVPPEVEAAAVDADEDFAWFDETPSTIGMSGEIPKVDEAPAADADEDFSWYDETPSTDVTPKADAVPLMDDAPPTNVMPTADAAPSVDAEPPAEADPALITGLGDTGWLAELGEPEDLEALASADMDFLDDLEDVEDFDLPAEAEGGLEDYADVDDFLATLDTADDFADAEAGGFALPDLADVDDFDDVFESDELAELAEGIAGEDGLEISPDAPDWLADMSKDAVADEFSAAAVVRQQKDRPLEELSDRLLALRDRGLELPAAQEEVGEVDDESVIADIEGLLQPIALDVGAESGFAKTIRLTDAERAHAEILREIVGARAQAEEDEIEVPSVRRERPRIRVERLAVSIILVVLMALPFFELAEIGDAPPRQFAAESSQLAFFEQIDGLQPEDLVLVAAEYGPTGASELDAATSAVIRHILVRRAYPVVVGGNPTGLLHVNNLVEELAEQNEEVNDLARNEDYTIGRYLVADVIGLRQFVESIDERNLIERDLWGEETGLAVESMDDFALIVVIVENAERLRVWAEQVAPYTNAPLLVVTGFSAAPFSEPYIDANDDVVGLMVGYQDAQTYNRMLDKMLGLLPTDTPTPAPSDTPVPTDTPEPTATEEPTVGPTEEPSATREGDTAPPPTEEPSPTREILPTDTPEPTATNTPLPTNTPVPTDTPEPTATSEPVRFAVITSNGAINVRGGPDTTFDIVGVAQPDERLVIIGENDQSSWYNVTLVDGTPGWVAAFLVNVEIIFDPTATPEAEANAGFNHDDKRAEVAKSAGHALPVGKDQAEETPTLAPPTNTPTPPPTATPVPPTPTPTLEYAGVQGDDGRWMAVYSYDEGEYRDERWYSITIGIIGAATIIGIGALINILAFLARGLHSREKIRNAGNHNDIP